MNCRIRKWELADAKDLAAALSNTKIQDNLRDGLPYPYTEQDGIDYISAMLSADGNNIAKQLCDKLGGEVTEIFLMKPMLIIGRQKAGQVERNLGKNDGEGRVSLLGREQKLILDDETAPVLIYHGLNGAYISGYEKWIRLDARGNKEVLCMAFLDMLIDGPLGLQNLMACCINCTKLPESPPYQLCKNTITILRFTYGV